MKAVRFIRRAATIVAVVSLVKLVSTAELQPKQAKPKQHQPAEIPQQRAILTDKTPIIKHEYPTN